MCGIAGILGSDPELVADALSPMTAALVHRGPDDGAEHVLGFGSDYLGLGHRRLSILDLTAAGRQPMVHPVSGSILIYNGEIYNFTALRRELERLGETFRGTGDTEVLLAGLNRWGPECLSRLQGMYALAFVDGTGTRLLLARDPAGIKPLYTAQVEGLFLFASEVRGLLASGRIKQHLDPQGLAGLLAYGAVQHPRTLFADVRSFPPGHFQQIVAVEAGGWKIHPSRSFWNYPCVNRKIAAAEAVAAVQTTLDEAVRDHLVADVPVGLFLSSGLDSTILAGLAARHTHRLHSFSVGFPDEVNFNELQLAGETARRFGLKHEAIQLERDEVELAVFKWLGSLDQPSMDGLNIYLISQAVRARGIKVALSGLGGDELFGGYPSFRDVPRLRLLRLLRLLPVGVRRSLLHVALLGKPAAYRMRLADMAACDGSLLSLYLQRRRLMTNRQLATLGIDAQRLGLTPDFMPPEAVAGLNLEDDVVHSISQLESQFYQGNMLLRDADANGMAHGLEIRVPFLDQRMLNLVHTLPSSVRLPPRAPGKYLLRKAFGALLQPDLLQQSKRGFTLPIANWMLGPLRSLFEMALAALSETGLLRPEGIQELWRDFLEKPHSPIWSRAFTLCVLGVFLQQLARPSELKPVA